MGSLKVVTVVGYAHLAPYLLNGDSSGMEPEEIVLAEKFWKYCGGEIVSCSDDSSFGKPDNGGRKGEVTEYSVLVRVE